MNMPSRSYEAPNTNYRYGFNGQEKSDEIFEGSTTALFWEYDSRTGRRWNVDPEGTDWESPYATLGNNPIGNIDPYGDIYIKNNNGGNPSPGGCSGSGGDEPKGHWFWKEIKDKSGKVTDLSYLFQWGNNKPEDDGYKGYTQFADNNLRRTVFGKSGEVLLTLNLNGSYDLVSPNSEVGAVHGEKKWNGHLANGGFWSIRAGHPLSGANSLNLLEYLPWGVGAKTAHWGGKLLFKGAVKLLGRKTLAQVLKAINITGRIAKSGMNNGQAGKFFGWGTGKVTRSISEFSKEMLEKNGWTKEILKNVAEGYQKISSAQPKGSPGQLSAESRANQLLELVKKYF